MSGPNVVFILGDQHRWDFIGYADSGATITPKLDAMTGSGRAFANAYCTAPLCCPSRAAIASGRYGSSSGCFTNLHQLPPGSDSFVRRFRDAGYRTAASGKTHMEIHAYDSDLTGESHRAYMDSLGWDDICEVSGAMMIRAGLRCAYSERLREIGMPEKIVRFYNQWGYFMDAERKADHAFLHHEWPFEEELHETARIARNAIDWLGRRDRSQPFMLYVGFAAPHSPIEPLGRLMDLYRDRPEPAPHHWADAPDWVLDGRRGYRAMITEIDEWVGRLRKALAAAALRPRRRPDRGQRPRRRPGRRRTAGHHDRQAADPHQREHAGPAEPVARRVQTAGPVRLNGNIERWTCRQAGVEYRMSKWKNKQAQRASTSTFDIQCSAFDIAVSRLTSSIRPRYRRRRPCCIRRRRGCTCRQRPAGPWPCGCTEASSAACPSCNCR